MGRSHSRRRAGDSSKHLRVREEEPELMGPDLWAKRGMKGKFWQKTESYADALMLYTPKRSKGKGRNCIYHKLDSIKRKFKN